jgi:hypothetical protein
MQFARMSPPLPLIAISYPGPFGNHAPAIAAEAADAAKSTAAANRSERDRIFMVASIVNWLPHWKNAGRPLFCQSAAESRAGRCRSQTLPPTVPGLFFAG